jgi:hypothetical protein
MKEFYDNPKNSDMIPKNFNDSSYFKSLSFGEQWYLTSIIIHINFFENYYELKGKKKINATIEDEFKGRVNEFKTLLTKDKNLIQLLLKSGQFSRLRVLSMTPEVKDNLSIAISDYIKKLIIQEFKKEFIDPFKRYKDEISSRNKSSNTIYIIEKEVSKKNRTIPKSTSPKYFTWLGTRQRLTKIIKASIDNDLFDIDLYSDMNKVIDAHFKIKNEKCDRLKHGEKIRWKHKDVVLLVYFFCTMLFDYKLLSVTHRSNMHEVLFNNFTDINGNDFKLGTLRTSKYNYTRNKKVAKPKEYEIIEKVLFGIPQKTN